MFVKQILVDLIAELTTLESHIFLFKAKIWGCTYKVLTYDGEALKMKKKSRYRHRQPTDASQKT
jgi:hypothetical protein